MMTILCPICGKEDNLVRVPDLMMNSQDNALLEKLKPPPDPATQLPSINMQNEGLGCLGGLFFGAAFLLSVIYSSGLAAAIFGGFTLLITISLILTFIKMLKARSQLKEITPIWEQKMEKWERLYYCSKDQVVFDPKTGKNVPIDEVNNLL